MNFDKFEIHARPFITNASCKCKASLKMIRNGWFSNAMYCPKCEAVYQLKLIKVPSKKITEKYLIQCRDELARNLP